LHNAIHVNAILTKNNLLLFLHSSHLLFRSIFGYFSTTYLWVFFRGSKKLEFETIVLRAHTFLISWYTYSYALFMNALKKFVVKIFWNSTYCENTKEIMSVKEFVYLIQNHADLHKLYVQFSHQISFVYFNLLKNTNVLIKTFHIRARACCIG
jgi:hypothetical protein